MDGYDGYGAASPNDLARVESYERESYPARDREPYRDNRRRSPGNANSLLHLVWLASSCRHWMRTKSA